MAYISNRPEQSTEKVFCEVFLSRLKKFVGGGLELEARHYKQGIHSKETAAQHSAKMAVEALYKK